MATLRGCDTANARNQEALRTQPRSDLITADMEGIPLPGPRLRNADAQSGWAESSARSSLLDRAWRRRTAKSNADSASLANGKANCQMMRVNYSLLS